MAMFCLTQLELKYRMVCHDLQLSALVLYTCSTLCVVASGLTTPGGRISWAKNRFLENGSQPNDLSLL